MRSGPGPTTRSRTASSTGRTGKRRSRPSATGSRGLINADRDEIAFVNSTTHGIGLVAEGFPWRDGRQRGDGRRGVPLEHLSLDEPGRAGASTLRPVPSRDGRIWVEDLAAAMDGTTRVLAISHVEFASGFRNDLDALGELCRARGVALLRRRDPGARAARRSTCGGRRSTSWRPTATSGCSGPRGRGSSTSAATGSTGCGRSGVGWHSVVGSYNSPEIDFTLKPSAERWEGGSFNMPGLQALGASVGLLLEIGPEAVSQRILDRAEAVRELAALGRLAVVRLEPARGPSRGSWPSSATGSTPTRPRGRSGSAGIAVGLPAGPAAGQPARLQ